MEYCDIDHEYTDNLICPYCGNEDRDSWEQPEGEELGLIECGECYKKFYGTRHIEVTYSTEKAVYGTCSHCNKSDVVIENYHSCIGAYSNLCSNCGRTEKRRLEKMYFEEIEKEIVDDIQRDRQRIHE